MRSFLHEALEYNKNGLKVIKFTYSGPDTFYSSNWSQYREGQTQEQVKDIFTKQGDGIAMLCVDGIEIIDIDIKHDPTGNIAEELAAAITEYGFDMPHVLQKTRSGGLHIIYKCPNPEGAKKLAVRKGQKEAMIETKGLGSISNIFPTPGYEIISGDLNNIPTVTQDERNNLISLCSVLNEEIKTENFDVKLKPGRVIEGKSSWHGFDEAKDILELMEGYGWRKIGMNGDHVRLNRPGAKNPKGVDASVILSKNVFFPFTSSTQFKPNKAYSPSSVFAMMEHNGDFSAAAKELYYKGFGDRATKQSGAEISDLPKLIEKIKATKFDFFEKIQEVKPVLTFNGEKIFPVAGRGMLGCFVGHEKSGKSFVLSCIEASAIGQKEEILNFKWDLQGGNLIHFDNEQSEYFYKTTQKRLHKLAGLNGNVSIYSAYHLRRFTTAERLEAIEEFIYSTPNLSGVIIDGFVDLIDDYNNLEKSQSVVQRLMRWSDEKQCLIMGVLHANKGDGKIRGHFGSEIKNKFDFIFNIAQTEKNAYTLSNPTGRFPCVPDSYFSRDEQTGMPVYIKNELSVFPTAEKAEVLFSGIPAYSPAAGITRNTDIEDDPF